MDLSGPTSCKCTGRAVEVDHIISWRSGGSWFDPTNLRASCRACNIGRVDHTAISRWSRSKTKITLVIGPPLPGLLREYVQSRIRPTETVIDYETIALSVGLTVDDLRQGVAVEGIHDERNRLLDWLKRGEIKAPRVWVTSSNPNAEALFVRTEPVVTVDPGQAECHRLIEGGRMSPGFRRLVDEWYAARRGETSPQVGTTSSW